MPRQPPQGSLANNHHSNSNAKAHRTTTAVLRIPLLCLACVLVLQWDVASLKNVRGLYFTTSASGAIRVANATGSSNSSSKQQQQQGVGADWGSAFIATHLTSFLDAVLPATTTANTSDTTSRTDGEEEDDLHYSKFDMLDLLEWEDASLQGLLLWDPNATASTLQQTCQPPDGTPKSCCLGSFSTGGGVTDRHRHQCAAALQYDTAGSSTSSNGGNGTARTTNALDRLQQTTKAFFRANRLSSNTKQRCDICRIVELALDQNLTIALMGDSMHSQVMDGLLCELSRRNYNVTSHTVDHNPQKDPTWIYRRHSVSQVLTIRSPLWPANQTVTIHYHMMYLLPLINDAVLQLTAQADVVVLGFGLHWWYSNDTPHIYKRTESYVSAMSELFQNITNQGQVKLLVHRETSAQHFDAPGGEFSTWYNQRNQLSNRCQPITNTSLDVYNWREKAIRRAARQSNHKLVIAGPNMPPLLPLANNRRHGTATLATSGTTATPKTTTNTTSRLHQPEVIVLPYFNFTSQQNTLHPIQDEFQDCTHYCSSPFIYYPLWRSLRFAMERQFG